MGKHIVSLQVENIKRVRAVSIKPDGNFVVVGGRNAQGKSSVLDAIQMALGGGKAIPDAPIRRGQSKAKVVADLGDLIVERTISAKGPALVVRNAEGVPQASPQAILDKLCAKLTFDPVEFLRWDPEKQDKALRQVLGIDLSALEAREKQVYDQRTELNKEVKRLEVQLEATPEHEDAPAEEVSVAELLAKLEARQAADKHAADLEDAALVAEGEEQTAEEDERLCRQRIEALERELAAERERLVELEAAHDGASEAAEAARKAADDADGARYQHADLAETRAELATVEQTNAKVRANAARRKLAAELATKRAQAQDATETLQAIEAAKAEKLAKAKFPVPGLGFDESGPTLNGLPLEQASQAEKLRLSVAIGAALNPGIRVVLVRNGNDLDRDGLALLAKFAEEHDLQVWCERVSDDGAGCSVVIEDGAIKQAAAATAAED